MTPIASRQTGTMACCLGAGERTAKQQNDDIERGIKNDKTRAKREVKLLLLGMQEIIMV